MGGPSQEQESARSELGRWYDVVGIGFGPSNLALATAVHEHNLSVIPGRRLTYTFLEKLPEFGWHRGMLIDDATMQVSFLKDLATPRNPTSEFSFLSYLHAKGRLSDFINHQVLFPSRVEFHDYLEWVARHFAGHVRYGCEVSDVRPVPKDGRIAGLDVVAGDTVLRARNVVLAAGLAARLPEDARPSARIWHSSGLMERLRDLPADAARRFAVVGAGQSAAEAVEYLHRRFPEAHVHSIFSRYGFSPADDSPFVNRIFDPAAVRTFFEAPVVTRNTLLDYHRNTNYSVVDLELVKELYRRHYQESVRGNVRLHFHNLSRLARATVEEDGVEINIESLLDGESQSVRVDVLVYATGYHPVDPITVLGSVSELCKRDEDDRLLLTLDHRVETTGSMTCGIYVVGASEQSHGLSSSLLSNVATRSGGIVESILANSPA